MIKKIIFFILLIWLFLPRAVLAVENPVASPNNKFGIHIIDENDLEAAAKLVNSTGGDWGYVTLVIREDERDHTRWQRVFDKMRELHLIPLIRIATKNGTGEWQRPSLEKGEIESWTRFLNSLNWVIKNRYIIVGNEPNHAKEWGGGINPEEYASYLKSFSQSLKETSSDFFVLPAGLDASAPNSAQTMDEELFLRRMVAQEGDLFNFIDGWVSHSYPNPGFSGSEHSTGRGTLTTYKWEIELLKNLGLAKTLPVFITETGWIHGGENAKVLGLQEPDNLGEKFKIAFNSHWQDEEVVAVTPFILNYTTGPFDLFSWKKLDGTFYNFYYSVQNLEKKAGNPIQSVSGQILANTISPAIKADRHFYGILVIENTGQSIWKAGELSLGRAPELEALAINFFISPELKPNQKGIALFRAGVPNSTEVYKGNVYLERHGEKISDNFELKVSAVSTPEPGDLLSQITAIISAKLASIW